jgi:transcriptional regulator with XRE-family HTH domain
VSDVSAERGRMLGALLRGCRHRIYPEMRSMGPQLRFPGRIGKPVTQEEVAEAAGISRLWYGMMESGRAAHISSTVLARVADVLMLDADERTRAFTLAMPGLFLTKLPAQSSTLLDAFASLRRMMRRLWSATTQVEALTIICEDAMSRFDRPDVANFCSRSGLGGWQIPAIVSSAPKGIRRTEKLLEECARELTFEQIDDLMSYELVNEPGGVAVRGELPYSEPIAVPFRRALAQVEWPHLNVMFAHVGTRGGFSGQLSVLHADGRSYSEIDRALMSTVATLTSLALN